MTPQGLFWCGEGDLLSRSILKAHKLYTLRRRRNTRSSTNTKSSHTFSHTASFEAARRTLKAPRGDAFRPSVWCPPHPTEVAG